MSWWGRQETVTKLLVVGLGAVLLVVIAGIAVVAVLLPATRSGVATISTNAIGDTGPAGGLIFYDKGDDAGGWRYLEAAPASTEGMGPWGSRGTDIPGADGTAVGTGRQNTADMIASQGSGSENAAQLCDGLTSGGFSDWFLPSRDELKLVYANLKSKGLGAFQPGNYWSSSEISVHAAWLLSFAGGDQGYNYRGNPCLVRAVRAF
jgi:hypothetical protein